MKVLFLNDQVIIMFKSIVLVQAKGTRADLPRLMEIAQENLVELVG